MKISLEQLISEKRDLHILYLYMDDEEYKRQILTFIEEGIAAGEQVIVIENDKFTVELLRVLNSHLSSIELGAVHFVNSLYFYSSTGSYNPSAIFKYYQETIQPYVDKDILFRSWAHVEWPSANEPHHLVRDCEMAGDSLIKEHAFPQVCAYAKNRTPANLTKLLLETHSYILREDELSLCQRKSPM